MKGLLSILVTVMLSIGTMTPICKAQQPPEPQTIKGELLTIQGDTYVVKDQFGRLAHIRVDKDTKRDRVVVQGEKIEVQVSPDGRALSIKPTQ